MRSFAPAGAPEARHGAGRVPGGRAGDHCAAGSAGAGDDFGNAFLWQHVVVCKHCRAKGVQQLLNEGLSWDIGKFCFAVS